MQFGIHCRPFQHTSTLPAGQRQTPSLHKETTGVSTSPVCRVSTCPVGHRADSDTGSSGPRLSTWPAASCHFKRKWTQISLFTFFFAFFFFFGCTAQHVEFYFPDQGSNPRSLHWSRVLITGPLGKSNPCFTFYLLKHHRVKRYNHLGLGKTMHTLRPLPVQFSCELKINYCILAADMPFKSTWLSSIAWHNRTLLMVEM